MKGPKDWFQPPYSLLSENRQKQSTLTKGRNKASLRYNRKKYFFSWNLQFKALNLGVTVYLTLQSVIYAFHDSHLIEEEEKRKRSAAQKQRAPTTECARVNKLFLFKAAATLVAIESTIKLRSSHLYWLQTITFSSHQLLQLLNKVQLKRAFLPPIFDPRGK